MSPASYLTAPPRDAALIVADLSSVCESAGQGVATSGGRGGIAVPRLGIGAERGSCRAGLHLFVGPTPERSRKPETDAEHRHPGDGVEDEMVARDDDRE